jgi:hypothetical protein
VVVEVVTITLIFPHLVVQAVVVAVTQEPLVPLVHQVKVTQVEMQQVQAQVHLVVAVAALAALEQLELVLHMVVPEQQTQSLVHP